MAYRAKDHPELRRGEVFLTNASDDDQYIDDKRSGWECIGWKTKRRGRIAYDINNKPIPDMFPVFVRRSELLRGGIDPNKLSSQRR